MFQVVALCWLCLVECKQPKLANRGVFLTVILRDLCGKGATEVSIKSCFSSCLYNIQKYNDAWNPSDSTLLFVTMVSIKDYENTLSLGAFMMDENNNIKCIHALKTARGHAETKKTQCFKISFSNCCEVSNAGEAAAALQNCLLMHHFLH